MSRYSRKKSKILLRYYHQHPSTLTLVKEVSLKAKLESMKTEEDLVNHKLGNGYPRLSFPLKNSLFLHFIFFIRSNFNAIFPFNSSNSKITYYFSISRSYPQIISYAISPSQSFRLSILNNISESLSVVEAIYFLWSHCSSSPSSSP